MHSSRCLPRQKSRWALTTCLVFVKCSVFWGVRYSSGCLLAKQTDLRPLIPLFPSSALRIMGSLKTSSCQERSLGHHPDICSSVKPPHTTLCCILTFIPSHSHMSIFENEPRYSSYSKVCHKGCMYELVLMFNMFVWTLAYGGACFIVSVASCLVFPVFVGPFCWVKWPCLTWRSLLFPPPLRTKAGLGGLCRALLYCFAQLSTALHTYHTNQHLLVQHTDTVDMETTVIRAQSCRRF